MKNKIKDKSKNKSIDSRFSKINIDARFSLPKKKQLKNDLDNRFIDVIKKNKDFQKQLKVDKYGRKVINEDIKKDLSKYYNIEESDDSEDEEKVKEELEEEGQQEDSDEEGEESSGDEEVESDQAGSEEEGVDDSEEEQEDGSEDNSEEDSAEESVKDSAEENDEDNSDVDDSSAEIASKGPSLDYARGEGPSSSESDSSSDSDSDSDSSSDSDVQSDEEELKITEFNDNSIPRGDETSTFACVNMDWDNIKSVDLMATFASFIPSGGRILSVAIYPSEYGKKMMQIEESQGPATELFAEKKSKTKETKEINEKTIIEEDIGEEIDSKKFRKYQLQRLGYYYAVIKCDKVSTAKAIYDNCDGTEFESTANFFDLRYVPDGMEFDDKPRDQCTHLPNQFKPTTFVTDALQHSKVKLTWDETPSERLKLSSKAFNQKEIEEMDYKAYLASESESENDENQINKYKQLLGDLTASKNDIKGEDDMEITFTPGLEQEEMNVEKQEESTIDKYKRKEKERKKKRMEKFKLQQKERSEEKEINDKQKAEMELLVMDDNLLDTKKTAEKSAEKSTEKPAEKRAEKKSKKYKKTKSREHRDRLEAEEADFDIEDSRFQQLFDNPDFAIDTTLPQFKKTKAMQKIIDERRRRTQGGDLVEIPVERSKKRKMNEVKEGKEVSIDGLMKKLKSRKGK